LNVLEEGVLELEGPRTKFASERRVGDVGVTLILTDAGATLITSDAGATLILSDVGGVATVTLGIAGVAL
jgi:hypothetical protein